MSAGHILVVDDEPSMLRYLQTVLELDSYRVSTASNGLEAVEKVQRDTPDLVLLDMVMPGADGLETLQRIRETRPSTKVVMLSCVRDTRKVAQAMRLGAQDYLSKPVQKEEMDEVLRFCLENTEPGGPGAGEAIEVSEGVYFFSATPQMRQLRAQAMQVARFDFPVLLLGESGTGKEVLAHLIHKYSDRAHRTFLKINCAAMPSELLESELFGYEPGAFTGANKAKPGKFELCNKGTLLLDEIGEMSPALQAKLLQVLQDGQFSRLGGRNTVQGRCSRAGGHQHQHAASHRAENLPRRSLLPPEQLCAAHAFAARASRRNSHDAAALHDSPGRSLCLRAAQHFAAAGGGLRELSLAGKHSRAGKLRQTLSWFWATRRWRSPNCRRAPPAAPARRKASSFPWKRSSRSRDPI